MMRPPRAHGSARGQALVEFALILPILLILVLGLFDLGRAVYGYNAVANAARNGTRVAIVDQNVNRIKQTAFDESAGLIENLDDVDVTFECTDRIGCLATVEATYYYSAATPMVEALVGAISLRADSQMPIERVRDSSSP